MIDASVLPEPLHLLPFETSAGTAGHPIPGCPGANGKFL